MDDVIGILDKSGTMIVSYTYDAYGVPTVSYPGITETMTDAEKYEIYLIGSTNPFRYRSYYFDTETGFYYLNSRYYDPVTGRFINADGYASTGQGVLGQNMFAYCANNPVINVDPSGDCYYNAYGVWSHDNWETYGGVDVRKPEPGVTQDANDSSNIMAYSEHNKKGTTNQANRNKHENAEARRQRDNHNEKGDARRRPNPNKRHSQMVESDVVETVIDVVIVVGVTVALVYMVANDFTGVGTADDTAIVPLAQIWWESAKKVFA